jgi:hypothetical protein
MKINKVKVKKDKLDANFNLYFFLKELNGGSKISENEISAVLEIYYANKKLSYDKFKVLFLNYSNGIADSKKSNFDAIIHHIKSNLDLSIFVFSLKLMQIKPLLLEEAKLAHIEDLVPLEKISQLSLEYDTFSKSKPYLTRVNGALISLLFFSKLDEKETNFFTENTTDYLNSLFSEYEYLKSKGLEANQMFMLMFSESVDQYIIKMAGSSYEDRIFNVLIGMGIDPGSIKKTHDKADASTEFDFFFEYKGKTFGIGAKRTLRERYKQFIKTGFMSKLDVMIQVTLGLDLTEEKAKSISRYGVITIVSDEIYASRTYLHSMPEVYPASKLSINLLNELSKKTRLI